jgi:putative ABC transport system permease protein
LVLVTGFKILASIYRQFFLWGRGHVQELFEISLQKLIRHKRYAFLNIMGLAVGLAVCLLIASYVVHELSFETMYPQKDHIYRINGLIPYGGEILHNAVVGAPLGPAAEESLPEIEQSVRIYNRGNIPVRVLERDFKEDQDASYYLQPLRRIYIVRHRNDMNNDLNNSGSFTRLYIFSAVALLILLIAAINFVNLSTAKIAGRLKEVGVRKTCGAKRSHLVKQFLMESLLLTSIAMAVGLILFSLFKPRMDIYLGKSLNLDVLATPWILLSVVVMILVVGFLAGSYPAFFLSRFQAAVIFRSGICRGPSKSGLRRILVVMQFFVAGTLIVCTLIVSKQIRYSETKDLGFDRANLIGLRIQDAARQRNAFTIKKQILVRTGALEVASIEKFPYRQNRSIANIRTDRQSGEEGKLVQRMDVDPDFVPLMGLTLKAGRNFEKSRAADRETVLINTTAVESLSLEDPVGSFLYQGNKSFQIIGVLEDWNTNSIHSPIYPVVLFQSDEAAAELLVRLPHDRKQEVISRIKDVMAEMAPGHILNYSYISDLHLQSYNEERRLASLLVSFCLLTVFVACLGIFGLAAYGTEQRTKEIGIRKVLGSSITKIVLLFTKS